MIGNRSDTVGPTASTCTELAICWISVARPDGGCPLRLSPDATGRGGGCPQAGDRVVLGGELSEGLVPELGELFDSAGGLGEALLQRVTSFLRRVGDLGVARIRPVACCLEGVQLMPLYE
jgi:hypothetical protein